MKLCLISLLFVLGIATLTSGVPVPELVFGEPEFMFEEAEFGGEIFQGEHQEKNLAEPAVEGVNREIAEDNPGIMATEIGEDLNPNSKPDFASGIRSGAKLVQSLSTLIQSLAKNPAGDNALSICTAAKAKQSAANGLKDYAGFFPTILTAEAGGVEHRQAIIDAAGGLKNTLAQVHSDLERIPDDNSVAALQIGVKELLVTIENLTKSV